MGKIAKNTQIKNNKVLSKIFRRTIIKPEKIINILDLPNEILEKIIESNKCWRKHRIRGVCKRLLYISDSLLEHNIFTDLNQYRNLSDHNYEHCVIRVNSLKIIYLKKYINILSNQVGNCTDIVGIHKFWF